MEQEEIKNVLHEMISEYGVSFLNEKTYFKVFEMKDFEDVMKSVPKLNVAQYAIHSRDSYNTSFCAWDDYFICQPYKRTHSEGFCRFQSNGKESYFISVNEDKLCDEILYLLRSQELIGEFVKWVVETKTNLQKTDAKIIEK